MNDKVESFELDHTKVTAPYLRLAKRMTGPNGDVVTKFDIRVTQPNECFMRTGAIHTFEHLFAVTSRTVFENVIDFSPMGCRTGFYFTLFGDYTEKDVLPKISEVMEQIKNWTDPIPATTEKECGNAKDHDLSGAKYIAHHWLYRIKRKGWHY